MQIKTKTLLSIVGPTAIGKTELAINLANFFCTQIISADSRQFYKEMSIGTAKPSPEELSRAKHHLVDFISIHEQYNAGQFEKDALALLADIFQDHDIAVMVGGSGLYINAVINGLDEFPEIPEQLRQELNCKLKTDGLEKLFEELQKLDPEYAEIVDSNNPQRVIRALEVCLASGKTYSSFRSHKINERPFKTISIGLETDRKLLYQNINQRVDKMIEHGLIEEVKQLMKFRPLNALETVGYKELFDHYEGAHDLNTAIEKIKQHTRNYAKRQLTWFKKNENTRWFKPYEIEQIKAYISSQLAEK